jgi:aminoglycoside phosphotransferase (APT) family kinase protein
VDGDVLERLSGRFQDDPLAPDAARCLEAIDYALRAVRVPESAVHGDLWVGNLLVTDGSVSGVVDWEAGSVRGVPLRDPVRFALAYALYLDRHASPGRQVAGHPGLVAGEWGAGIRHMVTGGSWFSDTVRRFLQSWMTRTGVEPRLWRSMALRGLAEIAVTADDPVFARRHLEVFVDLAQTPTASPRRHEA